MLTVVSQNNPPAGCDYYSTIVNVQNIDKYIQQNKSLDKHLIFFKKEDTPDTWLLESFMDKIFNTCLATGDVFAGFEDFACIEGEGYTWADAGRIPQAARNNYLPYLYWTFEDGSQTYISSEATFFDERILIKVVWPTDFGTDSFDGCWYVTSPSFLQERIKTYDPYYRRHLVITDRFDKEQLENELRKKILTPLIEIPLHVRHLFLKRNMEYQGQLGIGER